MSEAVIQTNGLTKRYKKVLAVDNVDLEIPRGQVFALMGRNGAGKTSIIRMLLGLTPITKGSASVLGLDSARKHVAIRKRVGYVPEVHHMYRWMTIAEIARFTSAFYPTWSTQHCAELLDRFGLDPKKKIRELSRGMVAKVALTLALAHEPEVLVLDEPTSGLDAVVRKEFLQSIVHVAADEGKTVLISSHLLNDVERVTDRVALIDHGKIKLVEDMESLKSRMREIKVTFPDGQPEDIALDGIVALEKDRHEWLMVVENFSDELLPQVQKELPGATIIPRDLSLEEVFVALVGKRETDNHRGDAENEREYG